MSAIKKGTVKFFSEKGFGFITGEDGVDYFAHFTCIQKEGFKSLADGEEVEFLVEMDPQSGKPRATNITGPGGREPIGAPKKGGKGKGKDGGKGDSFGKGKFGPPRGMYGGGMGGGMSGGMGGMGMYGGGKDMYGGSSYGGKPDMYGKGAMTMGMPTQNFGMPMGGYGGKPGKY